MSSALSALSLPLIHYVLPSGGRDSSGEGVWRQSHLNAETGVQVAVAARASL